MQEPASDEQLIYGDVFDSALPQDSPNVDQLVYGAEEQVSYGLDASAAHHENTPKVFTFVLRNC